MRRRWKHLAVGGALFLFALALRLHFFNGFILGDDPVEFAALVGILRNGPNWTDQLDVRFGGWVLNVAALQLFGVSESTMFLPTWLVSASFPVIGYALLVACGYGVGLAALAGAFVATAPFEVMMGAVRSNDLFLALAVALACVVIIRCERRPVLAGALLALCFWYGFYVKLWAVYFLPPLAVYYLYRRDWLGAASFAAVSTVLHGAALLFWKSRLGHFFPFVTNHAATYPIPAWELPRIFLDYPKLVFVGSDLGTTLFGVVPFLLLGLLVLKVIARWLPVGLRARGGSDFARWDRLDVLLLAVYGTFFPLLEFVPNAFQFDQYYSAPRIFRYLTPLSFAMALHTAKMVIDATAMAARRRAVLAAIFTAFIAVNLVGAARATAPGRAYRKTFLEVRDEIQRAAPPLVVAESVIAEWLRNLYLLDSPTAVMTPYHTYPAHEYEAWLKKHRREFPDGTMLITGLSGYVFYGATADGFRLRLFERPLGPQWTLLADHGLMSHLPDPAQLWRFSRGSLPPLSRRAEPRLPVSGDTPDALFSNGMRHFDDNQYPVARAHFRAVIDRFPSAEVAQDARYFYAVTYFREQRWEEAKQAFEALLAAEPTGRWIAAGHYHIGRCDLELRQFDEARAQFDFVLENYPDDQNTCAMAREARRGIPGFERGLVFDLIDTVRGWIGS